MKTLKNIFTYSLVLGSILTFSCQKNTPVTAPQTVVVNPLPFPVNSTYTVSAAFDKNYHLTEVWIPSIPNPDTEEQINMHFAYSQSSDVVNDVDIRYSVYSDPMHRHLLTEGTTTISNGIAEAMVDLGNYRRGNYMFYLRIEFQDNTVFDTELPMYITGLLNGFADLNNQDIVVTFPSTTLIAYNAITEVTFSNLPLDPGYYPLAYNTYWTSATTGKTQNLSNYDPKLKLHVDANKQAKLVLDMRNMPGTVFHKFTIANDLDSYIWVDGPVINLN